MSGFLSSILEKVLLYDGSKGVMLQMKGLKGSEAAESWNLSKPEEVKSLYRAYKEAGSDVIQTNTFPGNRITLEKHSLGDKTYQLNFAGVKLAQEVAGEDTYVAASVGPTGRMFEPAGDLTFDKAYDIFKEQLRAIDDAGADIVNFETFTDLNEMRAAILAAKETTGLPVIASLTFNENCRTLSGNSAEACAIVCQSLGAAVVGANCSGGPDSLMEPIRKMYAVASIPLAVKANAGLPELVKGETVYKQKPEQFSSYTKEFVENGVRLIGGCCGTTPEFIKALKEELSKLQAPDLQVRSTSGIASPFNHLDMVNSQEYSVKTLSLKEDSMVEMLKNGDFYGLLLNYKSETMDALLMDFGDKDLAFDVWGLVTNISFLIKKPLIIKSESTELVDKFLRYYPGRVGVVISEDMKLSLSQLKHYGCLFLNENLEPMAI
ncbi:cobalamin-dependent methionine synthase I [Desulfosporosinus orientis DSM 765]|uniref:Cobalamin-dependent methionine synthase I n=1 Tax=Desulfosporosinus orientis (strain ATCC 19365 / DSM 765 / NCIMB 8382 / VKM B-1628 / Singapore I) TaxID=768706 RepID=G7W9L4_DESOD|nr:homocysteine S-methyltransferase family protein [Desulfosporosinus orientis]AET69931.1 cobalamin-dependent methionine synthase I [Desulfosporosinus orientis DSM 765]